MSSTVMIVCFIVITVLLKMVLNVRNKKFYKLLERFPSFPTYPVLGNLHLLCVSMDDLLIKIDKLIHRRDRLVFWCSSTPIVVLKKHNDITTLLSQSHYRDTLGFANEWIGTAILNTKYEEWKKSRKILMPGFNSKMLSKYTDVFNAKSITLVEQFKRFVDTGEVVDVFDCAIRTNVDTIVENSIGFSIHANEEKMEKFGEAVSETFKNMMIRIKNPWLHPSLIYHLYLKITKKSNMIKQLYHLPTEILKSKLSDYQNGNIQFDHDESSKLIIDLLIKAGVQESSFTEKRMTDELLHVVGAAVETTALNLSFLMLMLAIHQDIQQKVYEEIVQLLGDSEALTPDHIFNELKYVDQCIKETLRMFSPVVATARRTHKDCTLQDNTIVPANTFVIMALHWAQLDEELFENPLKWDPEHYSEQAVQSRPRNSFLSFGYGPRSCLGAKYAMMSVKTQITYILRSFHISTNVKEFKRSDLLVDVSLRSKIGFPIRFTNRIKSHS